MAPQAPATGPIADLYSAFDRLTRPPLATAAAALMLVVLLVVVGVHLATLEPPSGGRIETGTGDFVAFWTGAVTLHEGHGSALYDFDAQREVQARILGGPSPHFQGYLNPPALAVVLSRAVPLGFLRAFYLFDTVCALCLVAGLVMLLRIVPTIRRHAAAAWTLVFLIASYQPMLETTFGGQSTPITFALLTGLALALQRGSTWGAGVLLGLLTFKPQYAVGAGIALLFAGQWAVIIRGAMVGLAHWLFGAWWCGLAWPLDMLAFLRAYRPHEMAANAWEHFSWVIVVKGLLPPPVDAAAGVAGVLAVFALWWRYREIGQRGDAAWFALVVCGIMFASPHQQYYDVALLALPVALLIDRHLERHEGLGLTPRLLLAAAYVGYPAWEFASVLHVQPLFLVLVVVSAWAWRACQEAACRSAASPSSAL